MTGMTNDRDPRAGHCFPGHLHAIETHANGDGVARYRRNRIVNDLVDAACRGERLTLNSIWAAHHVGRYTAAEMGELYRLTGVSLQGFNNAFGDGCDGVDLEAIAAQAEAVVAETEDARAALLREADVLRAKADADRAVARALREAIAARGACNEVPT